MSSYAETYFDQVGGPIVDMPEYNVTAEREWGMKPKSSTNLGDLIEGGLRPSADDELAKQPVVFGNGNLSIMTILLIVVGVIVVGEI